VHREWQAGVAAEAPARRRSRRSPRIGKGTYPHAKRMSLIRPQRLRSRQRHDVGERQRDRVAPGAAPIGASKRSRPGRRPSVTSVRRAGPGRPHAGHRGAHIIPWRRRRGQRHAGSARRRAARGRGSGGGRACSRSSPPTPCAGQRARHRSSSAGVAGDALDPSSMTRASPGASAASPMPKAARPLLRPVQAGAESKPIAGPPPAPAPARDEE